MQSEDNWDLLGANGDQVIGKQLAGQQELVIVALINEDVQLRPRVRRRQLGGVVRLRDTATLASTHQTDKGEGLIRSEMDGESYLPGGPVVAQVTREGLLPPRTLDGVTDGSEGGHRLQETKDIREIRCCVLQDHVTCRLGRTPW